MADKALDIIVKAHGADAAESALGKLKSGLGGIGREAKEMGREAREGSEEAQRGFKGLANRMKEAIKTSFNLKEAMEFGGVAGGLFFIFDQLKDIAKESAEDAVSLEKLSSGLTLAGQGGREATEDMEAFANALVRTTTISKGEALEGMSQLASEGRLTGDSLKQATTAAIGLAARLHIDVNTAFSLVSRAVLGHMEIMSRYGVEIDKTKTPLENLRHVIDTGNQSFTLAESKVNTFSGAWTRFKNELGSIKADFGSFFDVFHHVVNFMHDSLPVLKEWGEKLLDEVGPAFKTMGGVAVESFMKIKAVVAPVFEAALERLVHFAGTAANVVASVLVFIKAHVDQIRGAVLGLAAALVAVKIYEHFDKIRKSIAGAATAAKALVATLGAPVTIILAIGAAAGFVLERFGLWKPIMAELSKLWEKVRAAARPALESIAEGAAAVLPVLRDGLLFTLRVMGAALAAVAHWVARVSASMFEWATGTKTVSDAMGKFASGVKSVVVKVVTGFAELEFYAKHWEELFAMVLIKNEYVIAKFANVLQHFFTKQIPADLAWFGRNWKNIFTDAGHATEAALKNIGENFSRFWTAIKSLISGHGFHFNWKPLSDGFQRVTEEFPKAIKRQEGPMEKQLRISMEILNESLSKGAAQNVKKRLGELFHPDPHEVEADGKEAGEKFKKGLAGALNKPDGPFTPPELPDAKANGTDKTAADVRGALVEAHSLFTGAGRDVATAAHGQRDQQIALAQKANDALDGIRKGVEARQPSAGVAEGGGSAEGRLSLAIETLTAGVAKIAAELDNFKKDRVDLNRYAENIADHTDPDAASPASSML